MDWKKENISAAELEKRQKEYMNAAMAMMKKSGPQETNAVIPAGPAESPEASPLTEESSDVLSSSDGQQPEEAPAEEAHEAEEECPEDEETDETQDHDDDDGNYGVYTADELIKGEYSGDGLKKAAEILEEMTRNTEMMKKLASGDDNGDPDTTDFPDFSGDDCDDDGGQFREGEQTAECAEEKE